MIIRMGAFVMRYSHALGRRPFVSEWPLTNGHMRMLIYFWNCHSSVSTPAPPVRTVHEELRNNRVMSYCIIRMGALAVCEWPWRIGTCESSIYALFACKMKLLTQNCAFWKCILRPFVKYWPIKYSKSIGLQLILPVYSGQWAIYEYNAVFFEKVTPYANSLGE